MTAGTAGPVQAPQLVGHQAISGLTTTTRPRPASAGSW